MAESWDTNTLGAVKKIPLLTTRAGPRDGEEWTKRLKEEYKVPPSAATIVCRCGVQRNTPHVRGDAVGVIGCLYSGLHRRR